MLFNTAFKRTRKAGDLTAAVARVSAVFADEAAAVEACCAAAAGVAADVAEAAVFNADDVDADAACAA